MPLLDEASDRRFSEPNRWGGSGLEEQPLRPELVAEVRYDKVQGTRFRHGTKLLRFRPDKDPSSCTWAELRPPREPAGRRSGICSAVSSDHPASRLPQSALLRARDGCTRGGSPGIFGKFGGYGASPTPGRLVALDPLEQHPRSQTVSSMPACTSPSLANRAGMVASVKSSVSTSGSSSQVTGADTGRVGTRPDRVGRGDRAVAGVLVVVDEDLLAALLLPPRRRDQVRRPALDLAGEGQRGAADLGERPSAARSAGDVDAAVAGRLRPADVADLVEHLAHDRGDRLGVGEVGARLRVEVDAQLVRLLGVGAAGGPGMEVDACDIAPPR